MNNTSVGGAKIKDIFENYIHILEFSSKEISIFDELSTYLSPNPRKIKRVTNIYRCVRLLSMDYTMTENERFAFQKKLLPWIILLEQWPVRMSWMLQILEDDEQIGGIILTEYGHYSLNYIYKTFVENRVYNIRLNSQLENNLVDRYKTVLTLDGDPEVFDTFLRSGYCNLTLSDLGTFDVREKRKLLSYTTNLNPAIKSLLTSVSSYREGATSIVNRFKLQTLNYSQAIKNFYQQPRSPPSFDTEKLLKWIQSNIRAVEEKDLATLRDLKINGDDFQTIICPPDGSGPDLIALEELGFSKRWQQRLLISKWDSSDKDLTTINTAAGGTESLDSSNYEKSEKIVEQVSNRNYTSLPPFSTVGSTIDDLTNNETPPNNYDDRKLPGNDPRRSAAAEASSGSNTLLSNSENSESFKAQSRTTDDKTGRDHVGYLNYALVLAMLIHKGVSAPTVFGLYANWGTGKSFIMRKVIVSLQMLWLRDRLRDNYESEENADFITHDTELLYMLENKENDLEELYQWYVLGCPGDCINHTDKIGVHLNSDQVTKKWQKRVKPFIWQEFLISFFQWPTSNFEWNKNLTSSKSLYAALHDAREREVRERDMKSDKQIDDFDYEFVWWNAWLYSGSDVLWAGLIKQLYDFTEKHYGTNYANAAEKAKVLRLLFCLSGFITSLIVTALNLRSKTIADVNIVVGIVTGIMSVIFAGWNQLSAASKPSDSLKKSINSPGFREKLGFMAVVQDNFTSIGEVLRDPSRVTNVWDELIPGWFPFSDTIKMVCAKVFGGCVELKNGRPSKFIIFVDDLDRCDPKNVMEVLRSLVLLVENMPFIVLLAVDPRVVVTAIEGVNDNFFISAGVSGYEFLDKIVNIPFSILTLVKEEKSKLCKGFLVENKKRGKEMTVTSGLELWLDATAEETIDFLPNNLGQVTSWKSREVPGTATVGRCLTAEFGNPIFHNRELKSPSAIEFDYNNSMKIGPPMDKIQTIISVHKFKDGRNSAYHYIFTGEHQSPFHGGNGMIASSHGRNGQGSPFNDARIRLNGVKSDLTERTLAWKDEFKVASVVMSTGAVPVDNNSLRINRIGRDREFHEFPGLVSELLVWNRALSVDEVLSVEDYLHEKHLQIKIRNSDIFKYDPWNGNCHSKWVNGELWIARNLNSTDGTEVWKSINGGGKKLITLGTRIEILWDNKSIRFAEAVDANTIIVWHDDRQYKFTRLV